MFKNTNIMYHITLLLIHILEYIIYVSTLNAANDLLMNVINKSVTIFNYFE